MADAPNTVSTLNGLFKVVYADKLQDLVPEFAILQKRIEFVSADKETGSYYAQPVNLSHESGFTYNGTAGGVASLNDAVAGTMKEAQVYGSEMILRAQLSYTALSRASKAGPKAFKRASAWKVEDMNNSARARIEIAMLYGGVGIGTVSTVTDLTGGSAEIVLTDASWAGGIWAGAEGAFLDSYTATVKNNSGTLKITGVDSDLKKLTVAYSGTIASDSAAGDILYFAGAYGNEMAGVQKILTATTTQFNIDPSAYSLWKGSSVASFGQPSFAKTQDSAARAVNKGFMGKGLILVSPKHFGALNSDQAALRVFDQKYVASKGENGFESLAFHGVNGAPLEVLSHPMVKDGDMFILPEDSMMRVGSVDLSFGIPGMDEQFFTLVPAKSAVELQCMADQAIFIEKPAHGVYCSGVSYS